MSTLDQHGYSEADLVAIIQSRLEANPDKRAKLAGTLQFKSLLSLLRPDSLFLCLHSDSSRSSPRHRFLLACFRLLIESLFVLELSAYPPLAS